jgi:pSer/pThr/pTyr-binding forkhead associated (FHA) protein
MKAKCCIKMNGPSTTIVNPDNGKEKTFAFDFSYWSHDAFETDEKGFMVAVDNRYASQRTVFDDIGQSILDNAFQGYNCSLFAYGQTGAGKSYSMVGYGVNKGIIPICCEEMFMRTEKNEDPDLEYQISVSMLEIYNEQVRDLLNPKGNPPGGLKVRSRPGVGVYVDGLTPVAVADYPQIEARMEEGTRNRTVASTKMNATSSRAHTVFTIQFTMIKKMGEAKSELTSKINLVDLAGSERSTSTGATGDRLKEGCAINQSLSALGNVISALADKAMGKKKVFIPYRNSVLTRLLQDALGGNSKTVMIAALSPADVNYDETLSTLRYADRAKKIKNDVSKNENPTDKMIRELKEENTRLMKLLEGKGVDVGAATASGGASAAADDEATVRLRKQLEDQMQENQRIMQDLNKSWEQKLKEATDASGGGDGGAVSASSAASMNLPYLINLHEDPMLSECVVYVFKDGLTRIGRKNGDPKPDIVLAGLNIKKNHAEVTNDSGAITIAPINNAKTFVNGALVTDPTVLANGDRVIIGNNFVFRFHDPTKDEEDEEELDWSAAMEEFTTKQGLRVQQSLNTGDDAEDDQKRSELEARLAEMEAKMEAEREKAQQALQAQKQIYQQRLASGEQLSDEEKARLANVEAEYETKTKAMEAEKQMATKMLTEQRKRRRQNRALESQLAHLTPLVNDANAMSDEMEKGVKFELKLQVDSGDMHAQQDASAALKQISAVIHVVQHDGSINKWDSQKFENRLYMIREMYQEFSEYGMRDIPLDQDPFWDPPEANDIGKSYVYLKALSQLVEIENSFAVIDYKGEERGKITVEIVPTGPNGEELDYLNSSDELLGMAVHFGVRVVSVQGIPAEFAHDVCVKFSFLGNEYESKAVSCNHTTASFNSESVAAVNQVDEHTLQYLLKQAIVFHVVGFTAHQLEQLQALADAGYSNQAQHFAQNDFKCDQCEEQAADVECSECARALCNNCDQLLHKSAKKAAHTRIAVGDAAKLNYEEPSGFEEEDGGGAAPTNGDVPVCDQCEEVYASVICHDCERPLCDGCNALLHKSARKAQHAREAIGGTFAPSDADNATTYMCEQCEEAGATVKCHDCDRSFCDGCNALLHKSARKAQHERIALM